MRFYLPYLSRRTLAALVLGVVLLTAGVFAVLGSSAHLPRSVTTTTTTTTIPAPAHASALAAAVALIKNSTNYSCPASSVSHCHLGPTRTDLSRSFAALHAIVLTHNLGSIAADPRLVEVSFPKMLPPFSLCLEVPDTFAPQATERTCP
jgi:hypothetical protein